MSSSKGSAKEEVLQEAMEELLYMYKETGGDARVKEVVEGLLYLLNIYYPPPSSSFTLRCSFCDEKAENVTAVPEGWFSGRLRRKPVQDICLVPEEGRIVEKRPILPSLDLVDLIQAPIMCPYHTKQIHLLTAPK